LGNLVSGGREAEGAGAASALPAIWLTEDPSRATEAPPIFRKSRRCTVDLVIDFDKSFLLKGRKYNTKLDTLQMGSIPLRTEGSHYA
jgi:hypothetical protein